MLIKFPTKQNTLSYCLKRLNVSWNKLACLLTVEGSLVSTWIYTVWQLADIWRICLIGGPVETHFWNESEILHGSFLFEYQFSSLLSQKNCLESEKKSQLLYFELFARLTEVWNEASATVSVKPLNSRSCRVSCISDHWGAGTCFLCLLIKTTTHSSTIGVLVISLHLSQITGMADR